MHTHSRKLRHRRRGRPTIAGLAVAAAVAASSTLVAAPASGLLAAGNGDGPAVVVKRGLDNPRQLSLLPNGRVVVAEAGHGSYQRSNCARRTCVGRTGKVGVLRPGGAYKHVMTHLLSGAGRNGSFAIGSDGAGKRPGGRFQAVIAYAPPEFFPEGVSGRRAGKLLARKPGGGVTAVANITRFEKRHDPDGEGFDSNPYSLLALRGQTLVADAAGDSIISVRRGKTRLWSTLPEYGKRVDAVPTVISKGGDGNVYVGELHSEKPGLAQVWKYNRRGERLRSWGGFTTVTGVARTKNGTLYVSELFAQGGSESAPGQVVRVAPDGERTALPVPFPGGVVARGNRVLVAAYSTAPARGLDPDHPRQSSGQIWRLRFPD